MPSSGPVTLGFYDYGIVILSVLISILAVSPPFVRSWQVAASLGNTRLGWQIGGASASGINFCSLRYTGVRTFRLPLPVQCDWRTVLLWLPLASFGFALTNWSRADAT